MEKETVNLDSGAFSLNDGANGHFVNNIGIGFDAEIARKANLSSFKKWLNRWSLGQLIYQSSSVKKRSPFGPLQ